MQNQAAKLQFTLTLTARIPDEFSNYCFVATNGDSIAQYKLNAAIEELQTQGFEISIAISEDKKQMILNVGTALRTQMIPFKILKSGVLTCPMIDIPTKKPSFENVCFYNTRKILETTPQYCA